MKVKTNEFGMKAVIFSIILSMIIYTSLAFLAVYMFGSSIKASVLDNIGG
jgi:amino acid permease